MIVSSGRQYLSKGCRHYPSIFLNRMQPYVVLRRCVCIAFPAIVWHNQLPASYSVLAVTLFVD
jgi:hypothetical protein